MLQARYRPTMVGQERIHIHVIDTDTRELVRASLGSAVSSGLQDHMEGDGSCVLCHWLCEDVRVAADGLIEPPSGDQDV